MWSIMMSFQRRCGHGNASSPSTGLRSKVPLDRIVADRHVNQGPVAQAIDDCVVHLRIEGDATKRAPQHSRIFLAKPSAHIPIRMNDPDYSGNGIDVAVVRRYAFEARGIQPVPDL